MKLKNIKYLLPLFLCVGCLVGCNKKGDNEEEVDDTFDPYDRTSGYYAGWNLKLTGSRLEKELQKKLFEKHKVYVTYSQVNSYFSKKTNRDSAEAVKAGSKLNEYFYTGAQLEGTGTREHVWPCAKSAGLWVHQDGAGANYVDGTGYFGGGSDLYHIRTCDSDVNTARGDSYYVDLDDHDFDSYTVRTEVGQTNGKYKLRIAQYKLEYNKPSYAQYAEPDDHMKGDVARIILYVYIHYANRGVAPQGSATVTASGKKFTVSYADMCGSLSINQVIGYKSTEECAKKLMEWNKMDPPSAVEKLRNNTVQKIQGNRNPFVDFPDLVDSVFKEYTR